MLTSGTALALGPSSGVVPLLVSCAGNAPEETLRQRAERKNLLFGTAIRPGSLNDPKYAAAVRRDCNIVVPVNHLKWKFVEPSSGVTDFRVADRLYQFAQDNGMAFRGHTLVWHGGTPTWAETGRNPREARDLLTKHIRKVVGRYRGKFHSWDVVNEPFHPKSKCDDGLRRSTFLGCLDRGYISLAFRTAAEADPGALLVLNELQLHTGDDWESGRERRRSALSLLKDLLDDDVPIHAIGLQSHLAPGKKGAIDLAALDKFCGKIVDLGLKIMVTELDVRDKRLPRNIEERDRIVANTYAGFLDVVLAYPATSAVLTWGLSDRYSWLQKRYPRDDGLLVRGNPYDADINKKPAWYAIASAIDNCAPRP